MRKTFFDPAQTTILPKAFLLQYLAQTDEIVSMQSADVILKKAEDVLRKTKNPCGLSDEQVSQVILKALGALKIAAKKYEAEKKELKPLVYIS